MLRQILSLLALLPLLLTSLAPLASAASENASPRERITIDRDWRFAFGHPSDRARDFNYATTYFSFLSKAGAGDGPAAAPMPIQGWRPAAVFNDSSWRKLDLPHDWAAEMPFAADASHSHGYRTVGPRYPNTSVAWYRKTLSIPASDEGRRISVVFDGVFRDAKFWFNGFYLGSEPSGYSGSRFDVTDYLNYGGENTLVVRVDASLEEGWFYEGAGIYRHVWLEKSSALHVDTDGVFVKTSLSDNSASIEVDCTVRNEQRQLVPYSLEQQVLEASGKVLASVSKKNLQLEAGRSADTTLTLSLANPRLWSLEEPTLHTLRSIVRIGDQIVDQKDTPFGIRSLRFDPNQGFFLNGKHVLLNGTNNHQDHAGVGAAIPDALQEYRIRRLKDMGSNAYRCSHNPPTPEMLDACDRLGMLVIDETRLMGSTPTQLDYLERMIRRDRNHPSVILWSIGNEEWGIEGNVLGARIATTMQDLVHRLDQTRPATVASSGGWGQGNSTVVDVMGYNYIVHGNIDEHHKKFPWQPAVGTEETTTQGTRGTYVDDLPRGHVIAQKEGNSGGNAETGLKFYAARPFLAGLFFWTGFDYRGEPNPQSFPSVSSQFGILDTCGFPKDSFYYLKAWWGTEPVLHIAPHWNWPGSEGKALTVRIDSNADEVELLLNGSSLGRKVMEKLGHLEWSVPYAPGTLTARSFSQGNLVLEKAILTTGVATQLALHADRQLLKADASDVSVIEVSTQDHTGLTVPDAMLPITFELTGPGRIIGVGNGDPSSHEPDIFLPVDGKPPVWQRKLFNGFAQILVQSTAQAGEITLRAKSGSLTVAELKLQTVRSN